MKKKAKRACSPNLLADPPGNYTCIQ